MIRRACRYCGLSVRVPDATPEGPVYCCTGCAIADRIPVDADGHFPVNGALVGVLTGGFVFFNAVLAAALAQIARHQGRLKLEESMTWASVAIAAMVLLTLAWIEIARARRNFFSLVTVLLCLTGGTIAIAANPPRPICILFATAALGVWSARGFIRRKLSKKFDKAV